VSAFRDPLEALRDRARELAEAPVAPTHAWVAKNVRFAIDPEGAPTGAPKELLADAQRLGLRYVGRKTESTPRKTFQDAAFVHPSGRAFVIIRCPDRLDAFAVTGSRYFILTLFDDPFTIETCARPDLLLSSSERVTVLAGTNDLERDLTAHLAAVDARPSSVVLPLADHLDVLRALTIYYRQCLSADVVRSMTNVGKVGPLTAWLFVIVQKLDRFGDSGRPAPERAWWAVALVAWACAYGASILASGPSVAIVTLFVGLVALVAGALGKPDRGAGALLLGAVSSSALWGMFPPPDPRQPLRYSWFAVRHGLASTLLGALLAGVDLAAGRLDKLSRHLSLLACLVSILFALYASSSRLWRMRLAPRKS
jgi:hypothetical protein